MGIVTELEKIKSSMPCNSSKIESFEQSISNFDSMIESGIASRRGYNLQTIDSCARQCIVRF